MAEVEEEVEQEEDGANEEEDQDGFSDGLGVVVVLALDVGREDEAIQHRHGVGSKEEEAVEDGEGGEEVGDGARHLERRHPRPQL